MTPNSTPVEVVLAHGAGSDGSYWARVISALAASGVRSTAVQLPLSGFDTDVRALRAHLHARTGTPVVLGGHSYGGCVISEVAADNAQVTGLVYTAAAAPIAGVPFGRFMQDHPGDYAMTAHPDSHGLLRLSEDDFTEGLAHDLPVAEARLLWAVQKPFTAAAFGASATAEGWREKPCWYLVADADRVLPPAAQYDLAKQMDATVRSTHSGHMVALSRPDAVADLIRDAVGTTA